jgi:hypothetical protein
MLYLGLYASSPRNAAGYFAAIPLPLKIESLLNFKNTFFSLTDTQISQIIFYIVKIAKRIQPFATLDFMQIKNSLTL